MLDDIIVKYFHLTECLFVFSCRNGQFKENKKSYGYHISATNKYSKYATFA